MAVNPIFKLKQMIEGGVSEEVYGYMIYDSLKPQSPTREDKTPERNSVLVYLLNGLARYYDYCLRNHNEAVVLSHSNQQTKKQFTLKRCSCYDCERSVCLPCSETCIPLNFRMVLSRYQSTPLMPAKTLEYQ